ncbi:MAG: hypothetical protein AAGB27_16510 [Pseudomonadota bacterium]
MDDTPTTPTFAPTSRLNFVIGISAMVVSLASLYATFLQAGSAERQVKAMTYPLVQYSSGNYDVDKQEQALSMRLINNGVGPAIIHSTRYLYGDEPVDGVYGFIRACCLETAEAFRSQNRSDPSASIITSTDRNVILPANEDIDIFYLLRRPENEELWELLNRERRKLGVTVCYCSLLDECYESPGQAAVREVESCPTREDGVTAE